MGQVFSQEDLKAIEKKIGEVETHTAGEIVVHVVERSDDYATPRLAWAVILGAVIAKVVSFELGGIVAELSLELAAGISFVLWLVFGIPAILQWLVPAGLKQARVHQRSQVGFIENRVFRTRDSSGVLILVSLFERRVEILADEGIHKRVGIEGWRDHVQRIIKGLREGRPAQGVVETIGLIGDELKLMMPPREDDEDELSNEVVITSR